MGQSFGAEYSPEALGQLLYSSEFCPYRVPVAEERIRMCVIILKGSFRKSPSLLD